MNKVKVGVIGLGQRGVELLSTMLFCKEADIVAVGGAPQPVPGLYSRRVGVPQEQRRSQPDKIMYMQRTFAIGNLLAFAIVLLYFLKFYTKGNSAIFVPIVAIFVMYRLMYFDNITM